jgi:hypothetical protein
LFNLGARWRWVVNTTPWLLYPWEIDPLSIVQEAEWAPGLVWMGAKNSLLPGSNPRKVPSVASHYNPRQYHLYYNNHVRTWLALNVTFSAIVEHEPVYYVKDENQFVHYYALDHSK